MKTVNPKLIQACIALTYRLQMMTLPNYEKEWRKMSVISSAKKKELEDYRRNRCVTTTR